jgi:hypothetical protein
LPSAPSPRRARPTNAGRRAAKSELARRKPAKHRDFTWCLIAADWGWPVEEIAARLMEESAKARDNGQAYALKTATRAAEAAAHNQAREGHLTILPVCELWKLP